MKLPKPRGRLLPRGRGNVKQLTMIVEERGIGFWTRVRLPSSPSPRKRVFKPRTAWMRAFSLLYDSQKGTLTVPKGTVAGYTCNTDATRKEGATAIPPRTVSDPSEQPRDYSNYDNNFNVHLYFRMKVWYSY